MAAGLALLVPLWVHAEPGQSRLGEIRQQIARREAHAREFAKEAEGYLGEIEAIDRELTETRRSVRVLRNRHREAQGELARAGVAEREARANLARLRVALRMRLVALYKSGTAIGAPMLSSAGDAARMARTRGGLERVVAQDRRLFARNRRARAIYALASAQARSLVAELGAADRAVALREDRIRQRLADRRNRVALLRTRSELERRAAAELRVAAERLSEALENLPRDSPRGVGGGLDRGNVPPPVSGPIRLGFGRQLDPEFKTETLHNGIEIAADPDAPVTAVADGRVLFAGWFRGYGRIVILDHGRGDMTVSAHLDQLRVKAGDAVVQGEEIGTVGETGPLSGPGLYFEIRVDGKPVDPEQWLSQFPGRPIGALGATGTTGTTVQGASGARTPESVQGEP